jgi:predicted small lipoprotein YifL
MDTRSHRRRHRLTGLLLVAVLLAAGCGKRGPLYLPPDSAKPPEAAQPP